MQGWLLIRRLVARGRRLLCNSDLAIALRGNFRPSFAELRAVARHTVMAFDSQTAVATVLQRDYCVDMLCAVGKDVCQCRMLFWWML